MRSLRSPKKLEVLIILGLTILTMFALYLMPSSYTGFSILNPDNSLFEGLTRIQSYNLLVNDLFSNTNIVAEIDSSLWVPWYSSSTSCEIEDLQKESNCQSEIINESINCMVTDEFSQLGILISMSTNQSRMDLFYNTLSKINSSFGNLPSWRILRNGTNIIPCAEGINDNCDTASDADARIIISLFTASNNSAFENESKKLTYKTLAENLIKDFVKYEIVYSCKNSSLNEGQICYWLASGSRASKAGLSSNNFGYTGYYSDAVTALLQACSQLQNKSYCEIASNISLNYLEAAKFNGTDFSVPPGKSFRWENLSEVPIVVCTDTCSPMQWDGVDAPRALAFCQNIYYANLINYSLPQKVMDYCKIWQSKLNENSEAVVLQFYPNGSAAANPETSYFAQGLQALGLLGENLFNFTVVLENALKHYSLDSKKWDSDSCFGIYRQSIPIRALGAGIGLDAKSFPQIYDSVQTSVNPNLQVKTVSNIVSSGIITIKNVSKSSNDEQISENSADCHPIISCTWSSCVKGIQYSNCTDKNKCYSEENLQKNRTCNSESSKIESKSRVTGNAISVSSKKHTNFGYLLIAGIVLMILLIVFIVRSSLEK